MEIKVYCYKCDTTNKKKGTRCVEVKYIDDYEISYYECTRCGQQYSIAEKDI